MALSTEDRLARRRESQKRWREANPEKYKAINARTQREWRKKNPDRARENNARRQRRLLLESQEAAVGKKPDACEICSDAEGLSLDHCHDTGAFRGWLCRRCNLILGQAKDDADRLRKLAAYLDRPRP